MILTIIAFALVSSALAVPSCDDTHLALARAVLGGVSEEVDCDGENMADPECVSARTVVDMCEEREAVADAASFVETRSVASASVWDTPAVSRVVHKTTDPKPVASITIRVEPPPPPPIPVAPNPCGNIADSKSADIGGFDWIHIGRGSTEVVLHNDIWSPGLYVQPAIDAEMAEAGDNAYAILVNGKVLPTCVEGHPTVVEVSGGPDVRYRAKTPTGEYRLLAGPHGLPMVFAIEGRQDAHFVLPDVKASVTVLKYTRVYGKDTYRFMGEQTWRVEIGSGGHFEKWLMSEDF